MSTKLIVGVSGNSITGPAGRWPYPAFGVTSLGDASQLGTMFSYTYYSGRMMLRNVAITGARLLTPTSPPNAISLVRPAYIDPLYARKSFIKAGCSPRFNLYISSGGINDNYVDSTSVASYMASLAADCVAAKAAGADAVWLTSHIAGGSVTAQANWSAANALVQDASWRSAHGVDDYIDFASAAHGQPANLSDATYYLQESPVQHPTDVLSAEMGVIALAKLNALLATI